MKTETPTITHEENVVAVKQLRKDIDAIVQRVVALPKSRETSLAITKLEEGVMWLGMELKRLGEANPYPSSKAPETGAKIEPTADGLKFSQQRGDRKVTSVTLKKPFLSQQEHEGVPVVDLRAGDFVALQDDAIYFTRRINIESQGANPEKTFQQILEQTRA